MTPPLASRRRALAERLVAIGLVTGATLSAAHLELPPLHDPLGWMLRSEPVVVVGAVARICLAAGAAHLVATSGLAGLVRVVPSLRPAAAAVARGPTGRWALHLVGAGVLGIGCSPALGAPGPTPAAPTHDRVVTSTELPALRALDGPARHPLAIRSAELVPSAPATAVEADVRRIVGDQPPGAMPTTRELAPWVIRPGQHLWHVAEVTVIDAGLDPTVDRVATYHRRLVAHTRATLPVPDDPDLVHPGTVVRRPPLDGPVG